jgi:outer membrane lipoprotein-sorting protein
VNILRRASTTRIVIAGALIVLAAGAASIALAGRSAGPTPPKRSLASAIHHALAGPRVAGVTARVRFSNHLLASGVLPDSSQPLLSGATGRLWATGGKARLELQADNGDTEIGFDGKTLIVYNVATNTAYEMAVPQNTGPDHASESQHGVPSIASIQHALDQLASHVSLSGAIAGDVAGQPAYTVRVSPKHDGGLLGAVELAFDANRAVPLRIAVVSQGDSSPVLALSVTDISFGSVPAGDLAVHLAPGAKIVRVHPPHPPAHETAAHKPEVVGAAAVAGAVPFTLAAPASLVGVPRQDVRLIDGSGTPAAMVVYGHGLGAIVLVEQQADGRDVGPLGSLPRVSVNGASGHELATALGTAIQFDRGGVRYTLVGSLPPAAAEAAARALG